VVEATAIVAEGATFPCGAEAGAYPQINNRAKIKEKYQQSGGRYFAQSTGFPRQKPAFSRSFSPNFPIIWVLAGV
jgi:hypothetical protein